MPKSPSRKYAEDRLTIVSKENTSYAISLTIPLRPTAKSGIIQICKGGMECKKGQMAGYNAMRRKSKEQL